MKDISGLRRKLWHSLDMFHVKLTLFSAVFIAVFDFLMVWLGPGYGAMSDNIGPLLVLLALTALPLVIYCIWRTVRIFRRPEYYFLCRTKLCNPKGGTFRNSIKFTVLLEDRAGNKYIADTHSIFSTHGGLFSPSLEDYVNQSAEAAYNPFTEQVVIIG